MLCFSMNAYQKELNCNLVLNFFINMWMQMDCTVIFQNQFYLNLSLQMINFVLPFETLMQISH